MIDAISWYDANAKAISKRYEELTFERVHGWLAGLLPSPPAAVLDVGAGSGRDAAWLAAQGCEVVAVEPSPKMRAIAQDRHADKRIRWVDDTLPALQCVFSMGLSFDFVLLSAVWMHVASSDRSEAFRKLISLLKPGGVLAITLRHGPAETQRGIHSVSSDEIEEFARRCGAFVERIRQDDDGSGRGDVRWVQIAIRLPDDG